MHLFTILKGSVCKISHFLSLLSSPVSTWGPLSRDAWPRTRGWPPPRPPPGTFSPRSGSAAQRRRTRSQRTGRRTDLSNILNQGFIKLFSEQDLIERNDGWDVLKKFIGFLYRLYCRVLCLPGVDNDPRGAEYYWVLRSQVSLILQQPPVTAQCDTLCYYITKTGDNKYLRVSFFWEWRSDSGYLSQFEDQAGGFWG